MHFVFFMTSYILLDCEPQSNQNTPTDFNEDLALGPLSPDNNPKP